MIRWIVCVLAGLATVVPLAAETPEAASPSKAIKIEEYGKTPLVFEPNLGQTDASVRYLSRGDRYGLFLTDTEAIVSLTGATPATSALLRMQLVGQNPHPRINGEDVQAGQSHYIKGSSPSKWQKSVPHFLKVEYRDVYPGIGLTYYGNQRQLEYDFTVLPHANPKSIELKFSGAGKIEIDDRGDLILHTAAGDIRHQHPHVFQDRNGVEEAVDGEFVLRGSGDVGFRIGAYDASLPLVIDPKLVYSTFFGGTGANGDSGIDVKVDAAGAAYVTGYTTSMDFFSTGLPGSPGGNQDAFVMKVDPTGSIILSAMFLGGSADDEGHRIALDSSGNVYITGYTLSVDFPIVNGFQTKIGGRKDAYIAKIDNAVSQLLFSSYIGGSQDESSFGLSIDSNNNVYIAGETLSSNFPVVNPMQSRFAGGLADAFVVKLSPSGTVIYSTYLGGRGNDRAYDVASDSDGYAYVVGFTSSSNFPVAQAVYPTFRGGAEDAFLSKVSPNGGSIIFSTFLGGTGVDEAVRVVLDSGHNIIVSGYTSSLDFSVKNPVQPANGGDFDSFLTKFTPDGQDAVFSTYFGADGTESAPGLALDAADNIYLAGFTSSFSFPVINGIEIGVFGGNLRGDRDGYVAKFSPGGSVLYSSYIGGIGIDGVVGLAVDSVGTSYITGFTFAPDFPTVNPIQAANAGVIDGGVDAGTSNGFLTKIDGTDVVTTTPLVIPGQGGKSLSTVGSSNATQFVHATFEVAPGANRLAGMAIMDLRQEDTEVGEAALPLLPFITDARVYLNETTNQATNIAVLNPTSDPVDLDFFVTDRSGNEPTVGGVTIPPNSGFAQPVSGFPFFIPSGTSGTLTMSTTAPVAAEAFRTYTEDSGAILLTYLPLVNPYDFETRPTTIAQFATDTAWGSEFLLVNNTETQMSGVIRFYNNGPDEGDPTQSATQFMVSTDRGQFMDLPYSLTPRGSDNFVLDASVIISGYAQIIPDPGTFTPVGNVILTFLSGGGVSLHATVEAQVPATDFRMFAELNGDFDHDEAEATAFAFALTNPASDPTDVTLTLVNMDGSPTGLTTTFTLPPQGHIATFLHHMDAFSNMPNPFQGVLQVHASGPGVAAFGMRGRISAFNTYVGTTTGPIKENPGNGTTEVFPHVLDGGGYATQFIIFGDPSTMGTSGTLSFTDDDGRPVPLTVQ